MTRYADPTRCPDCGASLPPGSSACTACSLQLSGPLGQRLFGLLTEADQVLDQMRAHSAAAMPAGVAAGTAPAPPPHVVPPVPSPSADTFPSDTGPGPTAAPVEVRGSSVPKILLALGALCLLVAALIFLVVTWSVLGVGGRTATLLVFTAATAALTRWVAGRGLRAATESLGLVTLGLGSFDVVGARSADWLGEMSGSTFSVLLGLLLFSASAGTTLALTRTPSGGFVAGQLTAVVATLAVVGGLAAGDWSTETWRLSVAVVVAGLLTVVALAAGLLPGSVASTGPLAVAAVGVGGVTLMTWLTLLSVAAGDLGTQPTVSSVYGGDGAGLLVASALAAVLVAIPRVPLPGRLVAANASLVALGLAVAAPVFDESATARTLGLLGVVVVAASWSLVGTRGWRTATLVPMGLALLAPAVACAELLGAAAESYADAAGAAWQGSPGGRFPDAVGETGLAAPWVLPLAAFVAGLAGYAVIGLLREAVTRPRPVEWAVAAAAAVVALTGMLLVLPVPVWSVLALLLLVAAAAFAITLRAAEGTGSLVAAGAGAAGAAAALGLASYDEVLDLGTAGLLTAAAVALHLRSRLPEVALPSGAVVGGLVALTVWSAGGTLLEVGREPWTAVAALLALSAVLLGRHALTTGGTREHRRRVAVVEAGAAVAMVPVFLAGVDHATEARAATWAAVLLTLAGAAFSALALLRTDRRQVGWLGGLLLAAATWVRLEDLGVEEPEAYTLPTALALLVVGGYRLRRHPDSSTLRSLSPGLALALAPSLLWVLADPTPTRALLLGLACLALVVIGAQIRWAAPLLHGAVVGGLLVLREAGPFLGETVPRWALIGGAGVLLVALGVTWEQRIHQARTVADYLRRLR